MKKSNVINFDPIARDSIRNSVAARVGLEKIEGGNWFSAMPLLDMARASLVQNGVGVSGLDRMTLVANAFTHSSGDSSRAINSLGGSMFEGLAIISALESHPAKAVARVDGQVLQSLIEKAADDALAELEAGGPMTDARANELCGIIDDSGYLLCCLHAGCADDQERDLDREGV